MADDHPPGSQTPGQLQRIRYLPDWEVPTNPPKRPLFSRVKISKSIHRSVMAAPFLPKPIPAVVVSHPTSDTLQIHTKEMSLDGQGSQAGLLSVATITTTAEFSPPPYSPGHVSVHPKSPRRRLICGLRPCAILLIAVAILAALALVLGLGLGLGIQAAADHDDLDLSVPHEIITHVGNMTSFTPGNGACSGLNAKLHHVCAVSRAAFEAAAPSVEPGESPPVNPICGRLVYVTTASQGERTTFPIPVVVVDICDKCGEGDLAVSPDIFSRLAPNTTTGTAAAEWAWM